MKPHGIRVVLTAIAAVLALSLASCALPAISNLTPAPRTLAQAKADYQRIIEEVFAYIPHDAIAKDIGATDALRHLFRCDPPRSYQWPGGHSAILKPGADGKQILDHIATDWAHKPGWHMADERNDPQVPAITLYAEDGAHIIVYFDNSSQLLAIHGGSACFYLDHYDGLKEY